MMIVDRHRTRIWSACTAVALLGLAGCVDTRVSQRLWHQKMAWTCAVVEEGAQQPETRFSPQQLEVMAGKPDYVLSVRTFLAGVADEQWDSALAEARLRKGFARYIAAADQEAPGDPASHRNRKQLRLNECRLWVYEENQRFPSPLPSWGWDPGYSCYVFFVEQYVVGMTQFSGWHPLHIRER